MSEPNYEAIGRAAVEYKAAKDHLTCLRLQAERLCGAMEAETRRLRAILNGEAVSGGGALSDALDGEGGPSALAQSIVAAERDVNRLKGHLSSFGILDSL